MRKITILFYYLFATLLTISAANINVDNSTIATAMSSAVDGDVLLLAGGTYASGIDFQNGKVLTLKSAGTGPVTLTMQISPSGFAATDCGLIFDGLNIARDNQYFIYGDVANVKIIKFVNDTIFNVNRCLLRTANTGYTIDAIEIENTIIKDCGINGYNLFYPKHVVKSFSVKNSTLYNYTSGESFFFANGTDANNNFTFTFENNTVYKWGKDDTRALCNTRDFYSPTSTYIFRNNVITEPGATALPTVLNATGGTLTAEKNLVVSYGMYKDTLLTTVNINDVTLESLGLTSIGFADAANGDFSISSTSPLATASTSNGIIGDPRWLKVTSAVIVPSKESKEYAYYDNNKLNVNNVDPSSIISVYSFNGMLLASQTAASNRAIFSVNTSCIIKITSNGRTTVLKAMK